MPNVKDTESYASEFNGNHSNEEVIDYGVHMISAYQDEIEQLTFTNTNLNRTLEYLKSEANESEIGLKNEIRLLKEENNKLQEISTEIVSLREQCSLLALQCQTRDEELQELQEFNDQLQVSLKQLEDDVKSKDTVISILRNREEINENLYRWQDVSSKLKNRPPVVKSLKQTLNTIPSENRFSLLDIVDNDCEVVHSDLLVKQFPVRPKSIKTTQFNHGPIITPVGLETYKVCILGDSHARGLAAMLSHLFNDINTTVQGYVKPSASFKCVSSSFSSYKESDVLVLLGGSNDVYNGNGDYFLHQLEIFLQDRLQENCTKPIIVGNIPFRHDLHSNHKINTCIFDVNTKLNELENKFHNLGLNVKFLDLYGMPRNCQTFHGQHLNKRGKRVLCSLITNLIRIQTPYSPRISDETLNLALNGDIDRPIKTYYTRDHKSPITSPTLGFATPDNSILNRQRKAISRFCESDDKLAALSESSPNYGLSSSLTLSPEFRSENKELSIENPGVSVASSALSPLLGGGTPQMLNTVVLNRQFKNNESKVARPSKYFLRTTRSKLEQR